MRKTTRALGATLLLSLVAAPAVSQAGWAERTSPSVEVVPTQRLTQVAPLDNTKFRTRADRIQGMAPYEAFANSPYGGERAPPPPIADPANQPADPVYFRSVMGH